jgi:hypothetical protein
MTILRNPPIDGAGNNIMPPKPHCPHCGRGSNFAFPKIEIDWDQINREQFEVSRQAMLAKLDRFLENREAAYWTDNHFNRHDMLLIQSLLRAAEPHR